AARWQGTALLAVLLLLLTGPVRGADPLGPVPEGGRCRVHVYFLNGMDPCGGGNLAGGAGTGRGWGEWPHTSGQFCDAGRFRKDIARVHEADTGARFAVIGFSAGAVAAQHLCLGAAEDGCPIDLLVYLDGKYVHTRWPGGDCGAPPTAAVIAPG